MSIKVHGGVGHVVLKVRNLERAAQFHRDVLGLQEVVRYGGRSRVTESRVSMAFFSAEQNHHDIGILEVGADAPAPPPNAVGLVHVAMRIGDSLDELRAGKGYLEARGVKIQSLVDHRVSQSMYFADPDGNTLEFFVEDPRNWREDPVPTSEPLEL